MMKRAPIAAVAAIAFMSGCWLTDFDSKKSITAPQSKPSNSVVADAQPGAAEAKESSVCQAYRKERASRPGSMSSRQHDLKSKDQIELLDALIADACS